VRSNPELKGIIMAKFDIGSIDMNCGSCGSKELAVEEGLDDSRKVHCTDCGAFIGTIAGLKAAAIATAKSAMPEIADAIRKALKL
jgi:uncharacterized Zn finger protein